MFDLVKNNLITKCGCGMLGERKRGNMDFIQKEGNIDHTYNLKNKING